MQDVCPNCVEVTEQLAVSKREQLVIGNKIISHRVCYRICSKCKKEFRLSEIEKKVKDVPDKL